MKITEKIFKKAQISAIFSKIPQLSQDPIPRLAVIFTIILLRG